MTNVEIIAAAKKQHGIEEDVHTFAEWKRNGYAVRRGEHAAFKTKIWLMTKEQVEIEEGMFEWVNRFVLKQAAFFGRSQVEARR